jgi:hypothetical protein
MPVRSSASFAEDDCWSDREDKSPLRRLLRILLFISCGIVFALWLRSAFAGDANTCRNTSNSAYVRICSGHRTGNRWWGVIRWESGNVSRNSPLPARPRLQYERFNGSLSYGVKISSAYYFEALGFMIRRTAPFDGRLYVQLPYWFLALLTTFPTAAYIHRRFEAHRRTAGDDCAACGYDLCATPGRCPECGIVPKK